MKKTLLIILPLLLIVGCSKEPINLETLVERDGIYYTKDTNKPYTGDVFELYKDGGRKSTGSLKGGKNDKLWTFWYKNGQKNHEGSFKDGKQDGTWTFWYKNGQKNSKGSINYTEKNGVWTYWDEDGVEYNGTIINYNVRSYENFEWDFSRFLVEKINSRKLNDGQYIVLSEMGGKIIYDGYGMKIDRRNQDQEEVSIHLYLLSTFSIRNGVKNGKETNWYLNRQKSSERTFNNGELDGLWIEWSKDGDKSSEETYKNGKKDGLHISYDYSGRKTLEISYKDGKVEDGIYTHWTYGGGGERRKLSETTFKDGYRQKGTSYWEYSYNYRDMNKKEEGTYNRNRKKIGQWTYWYENGEKREEGTYKNGIKDGLWTTWYSNGEKKEEGNYKDEVKDGEWTTWFERDDYNKGYKETEGTYKNGKLDGLYTEWYGRGDYSKKKFEGTYKDGKQIRLKVRTYGSNSSYEGIYVNGILDSEKCWGYRGMSMDCYMYHDWKPKIPSNLR